MSRLGLVVALAWSISACESSTAPNRGGGGSNPQWTLSTLATAPVPTRPVLDGDFLYWADSGGTPFSRVSLTTGTQSAVLKVVPGPSGAYSDGSYLYWISGPVLYRTSLDGTTTTVFDQGTADPVSGVTTRIVSDGTSIYWANAVPTNTCSPACTFTVRRLPKAGGPATTLVTVSQAIVDFAVANGVLYWEEVGIGPASADGITNGSLIKSIPLAGGSVTVIVNGLENGLIPPPDTGWVPASWHPTGGIVVDDSSVYFGDASFYTSYHVFRAPLTGDSIAVLRADTTGDASDYARSFVLNGGTLYWADANSIQSIPKAGGSPTTLAGSLGVPTTLVRVGSNFDWIEGTCCAHKDLGSIKTMPISGGTPTTVVGGLVSLMGITTDQAALYWLGGGPIGGIEGYGNITKVALDGSSQTNLVQEVSGGPYAVSGGYVYFANAWTIKRVPVGGGIAEIVAHADGPVIDVAVDSGYVYWLEDPLCVVRRAPQVPAGDTGSVETLTVGSAMGPSRKILVQGDQVYFMEHDDRVERVAKGGGGPTTLVGPLPGFITDFVLDAKNIYISGWDKPGLWAVPIGGGDTVTVSPIGQADQDRRLAVDSTGLYMIDQGQVSRISFVGDSVFGINPSVQSSPFVASGITVRGGRVFWTEVAGSTIREAIPK